MRTSDIEVMAKVLVALRNYLPLSEKELFDEFHGVYERFNAQNQKEKQAYKNKAEYHREYTRSWRADNPEKQKQYDMDYRTKKKKGVNKSLSDKTGEKPSILAKVNENNELIKQKGDSSKQKNKAPEL